MFKSRFVLCVLGLLFLSACEGPFAGNREFNIDVVNGPAQMKICSVGGNDYLGIVNTNYGHQKKTGSLQFFSLANPAQPTKVSSPGSLELPSNVSDFEVLSIDGSDVLFVLNPNESQLLVYDLSGGSFTARQSEGVAVVVNLPQNPQSMLSFQRSSDSKTFLAVSFMSGDSSRGSLIFVDPTDLSFYRPDPSEEEADVREYEPARKSTTKIPAAGFFMNPRNLDDNLTISGASQLGYGVNFPIFLGGSHDLFVSPNALASAVHSFRLSTFQNMSNLSWNLSRWRNGETSSNGSVLTGSGEAGFRGVDIDNLKNVYVSNRTDNQIYKIPLATFEASEVVDGTTVRNTTVFAENQREHILETFPGSGAFLSFDEDSSDRILPRLGSLLADKTGVGLASQALWVIGEGNSKIYRVAVPASPSAGSPISISHSVELGSAPRRLLGYPASGPYQFIFVSDLKGDVISALNAGDLTLAGEIKN